MLGKTPLESLLAIIASVFNAHSALLFLPDLPEKGSQTARLHAFFSLSDNIDIKAQAIPGQNLPGRILLNQASLLVNLETEKVQLGYYCDVEEGHMRTFMGCPIHGGGVLCIDSRKRDAFADSGQKLLHLFALFIPQLQQTLITDEAFYFQALSKLEAIRTQGASWPVLLRATLTALAEYGNFDSVFLATLSEDAAGYVLEDEYPPDILREQVGRCPLEKGILGHIFQKGKTLFVDSVRPLPENEGIFGKHDNLPLFHSFICIPLKLDGKCCAVLCLVCTTPRHFSNELCRFVRLAGESLQTTLEKISLRYRLNSLRKKLQEHENNLRNQLK